MIRISKTSEWSYRVYEFERDLGTVIVSQNPYHDCRFYLNLELTFYDPYIAIELFPQLRRDLGKPLQVMLYASDVIHNFLLAGGFDRKMRCYELEVSAADLIAPATETISLSKFAKGTAQYARCCKLLYDYYKNTHYAISPLTADAATFCADLPSAVMCYTENREIVHFAFIEPDGDCCEIAYLGTTCENGFDLFARSLTAELFRDFDCITAECDDVDAAAMKLCSLFETADVTPFDTYILE